jgi:tetratricopeptide (TPR) repeat protein
VRLTADTLRLAEGYVEVRSLGPIPVKGLAMGLAEPGEFAEAIAVGEESLRIAQTAGHPYSEVWARVGLGYAHLRYGDFTHAARVLEPGLAVSREMDFRVALPFTAGLMGSAHLWSGRAENAVPLLEEAVETFTARRILGPYAWTIALAEAYLALGRIAAAREQAEHVLALARAEKQRSWEAWSLKVHGDVDAQAVTKVEQSGAEQAADAYRRALALATELGMRPLVAHCHIGLARLYRQAMNREQALVHLTHATRLYREMGMQFWLQQADREMRELP